MIRYLYASASEIVSETNSRDGRIHEFRLFPFVWKNWNLTLGLPYLTLPSQLTIYQLSGMDQKKKSNGKVEGDSVRCCFLFPSFEMCHWKSRNQQVPCIALLYYGVSNIFVVAFAQKQKTVSFFWGRMREITYCWE